MPAMSRIAHPLRRFQLTMTALRTPTLPPTATSRTTIPPTNAPTPLTPSSFRQASSFRPGPAPPKLPAEQQAEFERLQRAAAVSQGMQPDPEASSSSKAEKKVEAAAEEAEEDKDVNVGYFRGAKPEFEGDTNPKTGEVGGPKNEPLRWGGEGDWSYNGRVTDF